MKDTEKKLLTEEFRTLLGQLAKRAIHGRTAESEMILARLRYVARKVPEIDPEIVDALGPKRA